MTPEALLIECGCTLTPKGWRIPPALTQSTAYLPTDARKSLRYLAGILRGRLVSATGKEREEFRRLLEKVKNGR